MYVLSPLLFSADALCALLHREELKVKLENALWVLNHPPEDKKPARTHAQAHPSHQ